MPDLVEPGGAHAASDEAPTLIGINKHSPFGALLSRSLPHYSGPHSVGVTDVESPVQPQSFGTFIHRSAPNQPAGLALETVLFTLFYPAQSGTGTSEKSVWFPKLRQTVDGFLKMASRVPNAFYRTIAYPVAAAAIYGTTFPAHQDAVLKTPPAGERWPLVVFSHGVGCSRLMYTSICGELASRGYIVAAVEHRDGTGPSTSIRSRAGGETKPLDFLSWKDIDWPQLETQPTDDTILRHAQLDLRLTEFSGSLSIIEKIAKGEEIESWSILAPHWDWSQWKHSIKTENAIVMGHSLGGTAAIKAAADPRFSFSHCVAYDPAIQRIEPWTSSLSIPFLAVNSEEFAVGMGGDFPGRLVGVYNTCPPDSSFIFNIPGAAHPSFSDINLILPGFINRMMGVTVNPQNILSQTISTTIAFLSNRAEQVENRAEKTDGKLKRPIGFPGRLQSYIAEKPVEAETPSSANGNGNGVSVDSATPPK